MAQEYLPAPSNIRLADLMKEHNISQPELAKEIGCSKSTISRFISGAKGTLTHEQVLKIARLFNVSTDFLLGETNIPDRKNYDIAELGLSVEAAKNLYTGRVNTETVVLLSKGEVDSKKIRVEFSLEDMDMSEFQDGATYPQIKEYVLEHTGLKVSNLYISQIKRKCGIGVGKNYNLPKSEDSRQPQCPQEKEKAIREAFKYFGMI